MIMYILTGLICIVCLLMSFAGGAYIGMDVTTDDTLRGVKQYLETHSLIFNDGEYYFTKGGKNTINESEIDNMCAEVKEMTEKDEQGRIS